MSPVIEQLESFRAFVLGRLPDSNSDLTIDELYDEWRLLSMSREEYEANANAIGEALVDFDNGAASQPWEEFDREFRAKHGL